MSLMYGDRGSSSGKVKCNTKLRSLDDCNKWLAENGLDKEWYALIADDYTLQIDIDQPTIPEDFELMYNWISQHVPMESYIITESRSGNKHIIIKMKNKMDVYQRIALQAIFGSDPKREFFDLMNARNGDETPILLFERKAQCATAIPNSK